MQNENLNKIGENIFQNCFGIKNSEKVLVLTDAGKREEAEFFFKAAKKFTNQVRLIEIPVLMQSGQEPPDEALKSLFWADVALLVTSLSLSHTEARKKASLNGARIASLPGINFDIIRRTLGFDYQKIIGSSRKIAG
ncbi:MAG: aminopeptidase, partial [Patescibacteria group bacterium]